MNSDYPLSHKELPYEVSNVSTELPEDDSDLVNEFSPERDPLWYILRKAEITFERTRRVSERLNKE